MNEIKVGDRIAMSTDYLGGLQEGDAGTVIGYSKLNGDPLIEFDAEGRGHDGLENEASGIHGKDGHCWYVRDTRFKLIEATP